MSQHEEQMFLNYCKSAGTGEVFEYTRRMNSQRDFLAGHRAAPCPQCTASANTEIPRV